MILDKNLPVPLYHQLKTWMEEMILSEEWPPGHRIPTERELSKQLGVSIITVRRAINDLVIEGLLYRQQGKGTFVTKPAEKNYLYQMVELPDEGNFPHKLLSFSIEEAGAGIAKQLGINRGDKVVKIIRLRFLNGESIGIKYTYIPYSICPGFSLEMLDNNTLTSTILKRNFGIQMVKARICFSLAAANEYEAVNLDIKQGSPVFLWERYMLNPSGQIVEYQRLTVRKENARHCFEVKL